MEQQIVDAKRQSLMEDLLRKHELEEKRFRDEAESETNNSDLQSHFAIEKTEAANRVERLLDDLRVSDEVKSGVLSQLKSDLVPPPSIIKKSNDSSDF